MATVVLARFSASTSPVPNSDPDLPFTLLSDLLAVVPPPEPPYPPDPSDFPILGENSWLPFAGPFAPCIKRSQSLGFSVYWSKSLILKHCLLLGLLIWQWSSSQLSSFIKQDSESVAVLGGLFPKLPHALNGVGTGDSVSKMTLMFLLCEIVWNCQDAKEVSQALVGSALMVEALKLRSALLKAKELILLSFHIFSNSQVFIFTLRLGLFL
ncbi:hypothetical protein DY000_02002219 [Brassica cretica]|uniref:Uncharacterized protein n=1 Tax=Brassica cretica TaxID=69181 RepID=A0ABQ7C3U3_BRACR|nr:hypothetical protein DY000_02002219 [Brassica cretica]